MRFLKKKHNRTHKSSVFFFVCSFKTRCKEFFVLWTFYHILLNKSLKLYVNLYRIRWPIQNIYFYSTTQENLRIKFKSKTDGSINRYHIPIKDPQHRHKSSNIASVRHIYDFSLHKHKKYLLNWETYTLFQTVRSARLITFEVHYFQSRYIGPSQFTMSRVHL